MKAPGLALVLVLGAAATSFCQSLAPLAAKIQAMLDKGPAAVRNLPEAEKDSLAGEARAGLRQLRTGPMAPDSSRIADAFERFLALAGRKASLPLSADAQGPLKVEGGLAAAARAQAGDPGAFWDGSAKPQSVWRRIYHPAAGENTKWQHAPIKLVSYPVQKALYDVPNTATSLPVEAVTQSPWHNLRGAFDTFCGAIKAAVGGIWRMVKGILNPKNASLIDGTLQVADAAVAAAKGVLGLAKAAASVVAYPVYRLLGGHQSAYAPLRGQGKRAAIVFVASEAPWKLSMVFSAYKEQLARAQLAQIADYYCAVSWGNKVAGTLEDCLAKMPKDTRIVDFIALTHSGGAEAMDKAASEKLAPGQKPGLIISVGTYDDPSALAKPENTMGQSGVSFAVHYYFSGMMDKRLRGIPIQQAAMQAYHEGRLINAIDPISLGALAFVGYQGSKPDLIERRRDR